LDRLAVTRRWPVAFALALVLLAHAGLVAYFDPPAVILARTPIGSFDWETHYEQCVRAVEAFRESGQAWSYDPHLLAGQPSGAIFDADNKFWELWVIAGDALGIPTHTAFNLFVWFVALLCPLCVLWAARLFGLSAAASTLATALASACYHFDAVAHWVSWVGMTCWGGAAFLWLPALGLFHRWLRSRSPWPLFGLFVLLAVLHNLHPYGFFLLAFPMGWMYLRDFRKLSWPEHAALAAVAVGTVVANLWWLRVAFRFWHYILDSGFYLDATPDYLLADYLGLLREPSVSGVMAMRSGLRFLALAGAALGLWLWRRDRDPRFAPVCLGLVVLLVVAYVGGWLGPLRQVQPYRFALPAMYLAILPASAFLERAASTLRATKLPGVVWGLLALLCFVAVPRFVRDALYFLPDLVPRHERPLPAPPPDINGEVLFATIRWPEPLDFRHRRGGDDYGAVDAWVRAADDGQGRWLVEWWMLGEHLAWSTGAQILGGFREINLGHSDANLFRRWPDARPPDPDDVRRYLETYNVRWVILSNSVPALEQRTDLLRLEAIVTRHRVYRVRHPSSFIEGGGPGTVRARTNHIDVRGSAGGSMVLRYHWMETLRCRPACRLRRVPVAGDRIGFIGVDDAPPDFEIYNSYE
jgi:hypothetical protein